MSNNYEMMYILRPDSSEEQVDSAIAKYRDYLSETGAENIQVQVRGRKRLAYPINKFVDGIYVQMNYTADGSQIAPLERMMRLSDRVIRYLSLKLKTRKLVATAAANESDSVGEEE